MKAFNRETAIRVESLVKRYKEVTAVDNLSLEIFRDEVLGLLGPNGAGKSTSISMICGLLRPDSGRVFISGELTSSSKHVRMKVGLCPQETIFWPKLTCMEQLVFMGKMYNIPGRVLKTRASSLLEQMGLAEKRNKLAQTLSGGMKRRLNICLAIIHDPEIVVLDEPEAGLDPQSRVMVRDYVKNMAHEKTVILTTHNMDEAERMADRVAIIDKGRLLMTDSPENLRKTIGEGDILEITLLENIETEKQFIRSLAQLSEVISASGYTVILRLLNAVEKMPEIASIIQSCNLHSTHIRLRENTLEDVFIKLTGRSLRD